MVYHWFIVILGYTRAVPNGGPLVNCVPCNCNGRSMDCHPQSGICSNCRTGTTGNQCEKCMPNLLLPNCTTCTPGFWKISPTGCERRFSLVLFLVDIYNNKCWLLIICAKCNLFSFKRILNVNVSDNFL